jgi:hypothetical protein
MSNGRHVLIPPSRTQTPSFPMHADAYLGYYSSSAPVRGLKTLEGPALWSESTTTITIASSKAPLVLLIVMRFYTHLHAVFIVTLLFFTAFSLSLTDPRVREMIRSDVCCPIL